MKMLVSLIVDIGVTLAWNLKSSAGYPTTFSKALLKMGHRCTPKGRSRVGIGNCSKSATGDTVAILQARSDHSSLQDQLDDRVPSDYISGSRVQSNVVRGGWWCEEFARDTGISESRKRDITRRNICRRREKEKRGEITANKV